MVTVSQQKKDPETMRQLVFSIARTLGQAATYKTLARDMGDASQEDGQERGAVPVVQTVASYLDILRRSYVMEEVPGWVPSSRSSKRMSIKPKRYFADPSLAVAALGLLPEGLMQDWQAFGTIFENLCIRDLTVYAEAQELCADVPVRYYRDDTGLEVDAIIELADGRWAAFEIKTSEAKVTEAVARLEKLRDKVTANSSVQVRPPSFMAVITGVSQYAHRAGEGIYIIPIRSLTA